MAGAIVIDGRNHLDAESMRAAGFVYEGMGHSTSQSASLPETTEPASKLAQD